MKKLIVGLLITFLCSCGNPVDSIVEEFVPTFPDLPKMATCYNLKFEIFDNLGELLNFYEANTHNHNNDPSKKTLWSGDMGENSEVIYVADKTLYFKGKAGEKYVVATGTWICE